MTHLALVKDVKSLARLHEEQQYHEEVILDPVGISFTRGAITEVWGGESSGKASIAMALLARLTTAGEICAVVDQCDSFDPITAHLAGIKNDNLLWVRCGGRLEEAFLAADHLVQAKGFGAVWLNLSGSSISKLRLVPRTYWYRFRTRIKETPTIFTVTSAEPAAGSAAQRSIGLTRTHTVWSGSGSFKLLREFDLRILSKKGYYDMPVQTKAEMDYSYV